MNYDFLSPARIVFGWGRRHEVGQLARTLGTRALLVSGSRTLDANGTLSEIEQSLRAAGVDFVRVGNVPREPEVEDVDAAVERVKALGPGPADFVLGIGGGSALDLAKAVAALAPQSDSSGVSDYLEGVGRGLKLEQTPLRVLAMPTTAGTGTEATKNAVISSTSRRFKKSLRSDRMVPRVALVDPQLTVSVPPAVTAATGMDAITQLIEAFMSRRAQPIPKALCQQGLELAMPSIVEAVRNGECQWARVAMSHAALLSGMALANSGLGLAHGVAAALGVHCGVAHGLACAVMLPVALRVNSEVGRANLVRLAPLITGRVWRPEDAAVSAVIEHIEELNRQLGIPAKLSALGVTAEQVPELVPASRGNSMSGNPRDLSDAELSDLLLSLL
ncbi:MAG: iron-containing alcohol dehydrogenase [Planctomycetaceae bacterium]|nr:iron-containing alcohol dehydrogenase [Planctomycetaceae bacterium]